MAHELSAGSVFAGYRIERMLGAGGMGTVYLARNPDLPRSGALKVLAAELSRDLDFRARFVREADVAAGLDHPNIVAVHQRGQFEGRLWIAMQFVDGGNAEDALRAATMTTARAVYVIGEVAKALDYAHQQGVIHRDIKPANFLLSRAAGGDERVLLSDFGIARALGDTGLTSTGSVLATLAYAAPEVLAGQGFDGRADLYSLGCALFRLLTGEAPFAAGAGAAVAVVAGHLHQPPPTVSDRVPGLSAAMDAVIATAMAKDPMRRFTSAGEFAHAAAAALYGGATDGWVPPSPAPHVISQGAVPGSPWWQHPVGSVTALATPPGHGWPPGLPPLPRRPRRYRRGVAAVAAVMVVAAAAVTAVTMTSHQPRTATPPSAAALSPTSSSTTPPQPPIVTRSRLPGLLPPLDDVKNFVGIQNLVAHEPMLQPQTPNGSINPAECWPAVGGGAPSAYDLGTVIGFYGLTIDEPPTGTAPNQVGQLIVAFRDAATAQRHLADLASIWRRCGGRTVTLFRSEWRRPVELSTSVPEVVDGITTMVLTAQGPVLRVREDHAIAAKNNVLVDVDIMTPDTSRGQQAVIGITNYILAKIPG